MKKDGTAVPTALDQAARFELALAYRATGQAALADQILARLAKESNGPVASDAQFLIGQSQVTSGHHADAIGPLKAYLKANPEGDVADVALAHLTVAQLGTGALDDAWKTLATLGARYPHSRHLPSTRLRVADAALSAHQADRAAEQFRQVIADLDTAKAPPGDRAGKTNESVGRDVRVHALAGLGKCLWALGKPADAAAAFAQALELAPDDSNAPEIAFFQGRALAADKQPDAALKAYSILLEKFPRSDKAPQARLAQARLLVQAGRHAEAAAAFERLVGDAQAGDTVKGTGVPLDSLLAEWGWALLDADKVADADRAFQRLLTEFPESHHATEARFNLAESANQGHNHAEVIRLLAPLVARKNDKAKPDQRPGKDSTSEMSVESSHRILPAALYRLGRTYAALNDWPAAAVALDRLLNDFPDCAYRREAEYLRAESASRAGHFDEAEKRFTALLAEPPAKSDPDGLIAAITMKRLQCWVALKRWKEALDEAQAQKDKLAVGNPTIAELDYIKGQALLGLGRLEDARATFQSVINARKDGELAAQALLMRGETFFHQDQFHEALRDFLKVDILHDAPRWQAAALLEAGKVYERLDQWADAAETYERLLSRFPKEPSAAEARDRLATARPRAAATNGEKKG